MPAMLKSTAIKLTVKEVAMKYFYRNEVPKVKMPGRFIMGMGDYLQVGDGSDARKCLAAKTERRNVFQVV